MAYQKQTGHDSGDANKDLLPTVEVKSTPKQESCCQGLWRRIFPTGYCWELKGTMSIAWALILTFASQSLFQPVATMFGGHLGKLELDAISLSNTNGKMEQPQGLDGDPGQLNILHERRLKELINVLGNSLVIGFATGLDTVFSQSFGNGNYKLIGTYLQRGLILHLLLLMPCYAIHLNIKPILLALGQQEAVVELVSQYLLYFMPGFFFMFMWTALRTFTQCQNVVAPHIVIVFIGHAVHALLQYLLLYQFKFGVLGSSIAQASTFGVMCVLTLVYTVFSKPYKLCWNGWSCDCLLDWGPLAALGLFGMLMLCLEWWAIEAAVLLAGYMGETELGAINIPFYLDSIGFGFLLGIATASSIRVGQFLGAAKKEAALCAARVGMTVTAAMGVLFAAIYVLGRSELPKLFTEDADVIQLVSELMPLLAIFAFFNSIAVIGRGVFRGTGRQMWGTAIIFFAYYVVALPIAVPLTLLTPLNIRGIWIGFAISMFICAVIYIVVINYGFNWNQLQKEALERASGKKVLTDQHEDDEKKPLLQSSLSVSGLVTDIVYIPKSLYVKRVVTIAFFILLPIVGLIIRLVTQTGTTTDSLGIYNSTTVTTTTTHNTTEFFIAPSSTYL